MDLYRTSVELLDKIGVGDVLRSNPTFRMHRWRVKRLAMKLASKRRVREYLARHDRPKLQLGAAGRHIAGWLNTDIEPMAKGIVFVDGRKPFPFEDATFNYVFCEHFIEHLERDDGVSCMKEIHRCLKPGGVFRVATPDLSKFLGLFAADLDVAQERYLEQFRDLLSLDGITPCRALNLVMHSWGHRYLYTREELSAALLQAGFSAIRSVEVGESGDEALRNLERHQEYCGEEMTRFDTMVLEAVR